MALFNTILVFMTTKFVGKVFRRYCQRARPVWWWLGNGLGRDDRVNLIHRLNSNDLRYDNEILQPVVVNYMCPMHHGANFLDAKSQCY